MGYVRAGLFELLKVVGIKCGFDHHRGGNEPDKWDERCLHTRRLAEKSFPGTSTGLTFEEIFSHYEFARPWCFYSKKSVSLHSQTYLIGISVFDLTHLRTDDQLPI